ncbi:MAG: polyphosphate kinase 2 family protein [Cryobacterium sp.]
MGAKSKIEKFWTVDPIDSLRVNPGFTLSDVDTRSTPGFDGKKKHAADALGKGADIFAHHQEMFFASSQNGDQRSVLLVLQAMDTAGKGGIVRHVVGAADPQGVDHFAFKAPTKAELSHDFLWRIRKRLPQAGRIGVFDRSHYEDVLITRVRDLYPLEKIDKRYDEINAFEQELTDEGTTIVKVMLHISSNEQKSRLGERLDRKDKYWKYNPGDVDERLHWPAYQEAYQVALERTSTKTAPWFVVPADRKWYARLAVQHLLIDALTRMDLSWPDATYDIKVEKGRLAAS